MPLIQQRPTVRKPVIEAGFEETLLFVDAKRKQAEADAERRGVSPSAVISMDDDVPVQISAPQQRPQQQSQPSQSFQRENPLLLVEEIEQKRRQEIQSSFLLGIATAAVAFGGFYLVKWIITKPTILETALEATY
jgi:hypothetical protein